MKNLRIGVVDVRHFAGIDHIRLEPEADSHLLLIAGENEAGKSSLLNAITSALSGKAALPEMPVRRGERAADINIELVGDGGATEIYRLRRSIDADGGTKLEIRGPEGLVRKPQEWLDRLIGARFLDPLAFLGMKAEAQRRVLLDVAGIDTTAIDAEIKETYAKREDEGRALTRAKGEHDSLPPPAPRPPAARTVSEVTAEMTRIEAEHRELSLLQAAATDARRARASATNDLTNARTQLESWQRAVAEAETRLAEASAIEDAAAKKLAASQRAGDDIAKRRAELADEIRRAETLGRWEAQNHAQAQRREASELRVREYTATREKLTERLAALAAEKEALLAAAELPVPGLAFTDDGITLNGIPFSQASQARRLRTALVIAMRLAGGIRDVLVRDGSHLDTKAVTALRETAKELGCRAWVERVGEKDDGAIILRDGAVYEIGDGAGVVG
jgi:DNA repair exonuclease SbcCD ATPase subunit